MKYIAIRYIVFFILAAPLLHSEVTVDLVLSKNSALIGEPIKLLLKATAPADYKLIIKQKPLDSSLYTVQPAKYDTSWAGSNQIISVESSFSSLIAGDYSIEPLPIIIEKPGFKDFNVIKTNAAQVKFIDVVADTNAPPKKSYGEIEIAINSKSDNGSSVYFWVLGIIFFAAVAIFTIIFKRRKKEKPIIYLKIKNLAKKISNESNIELLYSELSLIFNDFLQQLLNINLSEYSNDEIQNIAFSKVGREDFEIIRGIKRRIELVNFARKKPSKEELQADCKQLSNQINKHIYARHSI